MNFVYTRRAMLIKAALVTALVCACYAAERTAIPSGSKVFVDSNSGFDIYLIKALGKNQVPLTIVFDDEQADFIIFAGTSKPEQQKLSQGEKPDYQARIQISKITRTANLEEWKATTLANYEAERKALLAEQAEIEKDPSKNSPPTPPLYWDRATQIQRRLEDLDWKRKEVETVGLKLGNARKELTPGVPHCGWGSHGCFPENIWDITNLPPNTSVVVYTDVTPSTNTFNDWQSIADQFADRLKQAMHP